MLRFGDLVASMALRLALPVTATVRHFSTATGHDGRKNMLEAVESAVPLTFNQLAAEPAG
jgi:hypothetical protein